MHLGMVLFIRTCVRLSQSAEPSAISNADMVSLETVELLRFFVGMMESGAKMNRQFCNALVRALENTCPKICCICHIT